MKRIQEKVKDLIEVRSHRNFSVFAGSPGDVLLTYHFTEYTSGLMSGWLDDLARTSKSGARVRFLAGPRGIGKSHFIGAFAALAGHTEIRARVPDSLVASSAQSLRRRRYPVALVRRGSGGSLLAELSAAVAATISTEPDLLGSSVADILRSAAGRPSDLPFVLVIDSEVERNSRPRKEDGQVVSEILKAAKGLNIFVAIALDGDLSVSGSLVDSSGMTRVDFLDEDSFTSVVEALVFPKVRQRQKVLHQAYNAFREVIPNFRWNEQRFSAVYPLHPLTLEAAPSVRSYAPDFGILHFSSEAGARIAGRPAGSLITVDEVFDFAEASLRKSVALTDAFAAYDRLSSEVVGSMPVMERLQAKLVLKALLILSLEGTGATASDISSALLIFDERDPESGKRLVSSILERYEAAGGEQVVRIDVEGRETRFRLRLGAKEDFSRRLEEMAASLREEDVALALRAIAEERFDDLGAPSDSAELSPNWSKGEFVWRGSIRRGKIIWTRDYSDSSLCPRTLTERAWDWALFMSSIGGQGAPPPADERNPTAVWHHAELADEEQRILKRYRALVLDDGLSAEFGDQYHAALHASARQAEEVWVRAFISEGQFTVSTGTYKLESSALEADSFADILHSVFGPVFDTVFPEHPFFDQTLDPENLSVVAGNLFGGARQSLPQVQSLAATFAEPLGLVARRGGLLGLESEPRLMSLPFVREVMNVLGASGEATVPLRDVCANLRKAPIGLVREAQFLVLAALVAARKVEFVTIRGSRISRRSLDLGIAWESIVGIAPPEISVLPAENLAKWVQLLTGDRSIASIDSPEGEGAARKAIEIWLADWRNVRLLERFGDLPDDVINDRTWKLFSNLERTFGSAAKTLELMTEGAMPLAESLNRVADAFADDEEAITVRSEEIGRLEEFMVGTALRDRINRYMAICEPSANHDVEWCRKLLLKAMDRSAAAPSHEANLEIQSLWNTFHQLFLEHFTEQHDAVMGSHSLKLRFEAVVNSDEWWEFEGLSRIPIFSKQHWKESQRLRREARGLDCRFDLRKMLEEHPFCGCSFREGSKTALETLPERLKATVEAGRAGYREVLLMLREVICETVESLARNSWDDEFKTAAVSLMAALNSDSEMPLLGVSEIAVLCRAIENMPVIPQLSVNLPRTDFVSASELRSHLGSWLDNLPEESVLLRV